MKYIAFGIILVIFEGFAFVAIASHIQSQHIQALEQAVRDLTAIQNAQTDAIEKMRAAKD